MTNIAYKQYISELQRIYSELQSQEDFANLPYIGAKNAQSQPHGKGKMRFEDGSIYEGSFFNGQKHGKGFFLAPDGKKIEEDWKHGRLVSGKGKVDLSGQGEYTGDLINGKRNGDGTMVYPEGHEFKKYDGSWENDLYSGEGSLTWSNGDKYIGKWKDGKRHGKGSMTFSKNNSEGYLKYEGNWKDNLFSDKGKLTWRNGDVYDGEWKNGIRLKGKMVFGNSDYYEGEFKDDKFDGKGIFFWADGQKYEGEFKDNMRHGKGVLYNEEGGKRYVGEWCNNKREGEGVQFYINGEIWKKGEFKNDKLYNGKLYESDYNVELEGEFDEEEYLKNGTFICERDFVEVHNYSYTKGVLYGNGGNIVFEGEFRGSTKVDFDPLAHNGQAYGLGFLNKTGEIRNGELNGYGEQNSSRFLGSISFRYGGYKRNEVPEKIAGYYSNGEVDGSCKLYFPCGFVLEATGDGTGSFSYRLPPENQP
jgi:hypothetical protein